MPTQWAVVADGSRARIFARVSMQGGWQDIDNLTRRHLEPASNGREQRLPPLARAAKSEGEIRRGESRCFLGELADRISEARKRGDFDQLILIAPSELLDDLRGRLDSPTLRKLVDAREADMAGLPVRTTQRELARMF